MKIINFKIDLRLNKNDKIPVEVPTYLPDTPENREYATRVAIDGMFTPVEMPDLTQKPSPTQVLQGQLAALCMLTDHMEVLTNA